MDPNLPFTLAEVEHYLNQARTKPHVIAAEVEKQIALFSSDKRTIRFSYGLNYATNEGIQAWYEAVKFLKAQKPLSALKRNAGLDAAARYHANDLVRNNIFGSQHDLLIWRSTGHNSSDGTGMSERLRKFVNWTSGGISENVGQDFDFSARNHPLQFALQFIIDDGVSSRGHRKNIFNPNTHYVGIGICKGKGNYIVVLDFAQNDLKSVGNNNVKENIQQPQSIPKMAYQQQPQFKMTNTNKNSKGDRYLASTKTETNTSTVNGVTTKVTKVTKVYSDGSKETETNTQTQTYH